ncbi:kelch-like protein 11 [Oculina patagonica]
MKENIEGVIRLEIIVESQMADILEFIYTGNIQISSQENAENLVEVADYLLLSNLKAFAGKHLEEHMTTSNCISIYHLAENYLCEDLIASAWKFICSNFSTVAEFNDFLNFPSHDVEKVISSDEIVIDAEENVFEIIIGWIEHSKSERSIKFSDLFRHVRLTCISRDFLVSDVVTNDLVKENQECMTRVTDALQWIDRPTDSNVPRPHPPRKALERDVIVVTAWGEERPLFHTNFYFPATGEWYRLPPIVCEPTHVFSYRGKVCVISKDITQSIDYDPQLNRWSPAPWTKLDPNSAFMKMTNAFFQIHYVFVVKNQICFIVAENYSYALFRYNIDLNSMTLSCNWINRKAFCNVVVGKHIYVIGGKAIGVYEGIAECARFDTEENTWQETAPLKEARTYAFGVSKTNQDKIFIAGGFGIFDDWLQSCEVYNIATDEWQFIASLTLCRVCGSMVLIDETIYVLGGRTKKPFKDTRDFPDGKMPVEWYDPGKDKWNDITAMPFWNFILKGRIVDTEYIVWLKCCSLRLFKDVNFDNLSPIQL